MLHSITPAAPNIASVVSLTMDLCRARARLFLHDARVARAQQDADQEESAAAESSPAPENFCAKTPSTERLPPFWGKPFLDRFLGEGA
jgi:hypothetical protein